MYTMTPLIVGAVILTIAGVRCMKAWNDPPNFEAAVNWGSTSFLVFTYVIFSAVSTKVFQTFSVRSCAASLLRSMAVADLT